MQSASLGQAAQALGAVGVLVWMVRYFMGKLDSRDAQWCNVIAIIEKNTASNEKLAHAVERLEARMERVENSSPALRMVEPRP